jgi:hypothetical protein
MVDKVSLPMYYQFTQKMVDKAREGPLYLRSSKPDKKIVDKVRGYMY